MTRLVLSSSFSSSINCNTCSPLPESRLPVGSSARTSWGRVINVTGMNAIAGYAGRAPVSVAKHGLWGLTKALAREFGPQGIRINAVAPGLTQTEMTTDLMQSEEGRRRLKDLPLGRLGRPDEVADAVIFLLTDAATLFLGQTLNPNSGGYMT